MENLEIRQVIVVRTDLEMPLGKLISQCCHASQLAKEQQENNPIYFDFLNEWKLTGRTKITVGIKSEEKLNNLVEKALNLGINVYVVTDEGRTVFNGVPTVTCACFGVAPKELLDKITGRLRLLQ